MIVRIWRGVTPEGKADRYLDYMLATGVRDYRTIPGNRGVQVLRRVGEARVEFLLLSWWDSFDAIRRYTGSDPERAVYYAEDKDYLLELEATVRHYEVVFQSGEA